MLKQDRPRRLERTEHDSAVEHQLQAVFRGSVQQAVARTHMVQQIRQGNRLIFAVASLRGQPARRSGHMDGNCNHVADRIVRIIGWLRRIADAHLRLRKLDTGSEVRHAHEMRLRHSSQGAVVTAMLFERCRRMRLQLIGSAHRMERKGFADYCGNQGDVQSNKF